MLTHNPILFIPLTYQYSISAFATNTAGERAVIIPCIRGSDTPAELQYNRALDARNAVLRRLPPRGFLSFRTSAAEPRILLAYHSVSINKACGTLKFVLGSRPTVVNTTTKRVDAGD